MAIGKHKISTVTYEDPKKTVKGFEQSWEANLKLLGKVVAQKNTIEEQSIQFRMMADDFEHQVVQFQEFLQGVPVLSAIKAWLGGKLSDPQWKMRYFDNMTVLFQQNLIPVVDGRGKLITLEYFIEHGHQAILEDIRSVTGWTMIEKEEIVQCYVAFTQSLARLSHNLVPYGVDPDRERVRQKAVSYEVFIDFIPHLSERDALIAKLLYFCDLSIEEVINLKKAAFEKNSFSIKLDDRTIQLPRHLFLELFTFVNNSEKSQKLAFTNVRGAQVDRAHLNQTFSRASERSVKKEKITPGSLLKLKNEQDA